MRGLRSPRYTPALAPLLLSRGILAGCAAFSCLAQWMLRARGTMRPTNLAYLFRSSALIFAVTLSIGGSVACSERVG
jgi:O-antigen/teichoic acid export membrane protein